MTCYLAWSSKRVSHVISTHPSTMIGIINQIQASITSEGIYRLGEYEENATEKQKDTNIQDRTQAPLKPSHEDGKHQFPLQSSKARSIKRFGENISQLSLYISMYLISISPFLIWSLKKLCLILWWKTGFLATELALVLSHMRGTLSKFTPKSLMVYKIHRIWEQQLAATTYSASVVD
jgi:hypothetical protein